MSEPRRGPTNDLYRYSGLGLQFAASVALFALGGPWLDGRMGSSPWFLLVGVFLGFAGGLISILKKFPSSHGRAIQHCEDANHEFEQMKAFRIDGSVS